MIITPWSYIILKFNIWDTDLEVMMNNLKYIDYNMITQDMTKR